VLEREHEKALRPERTCGSGHHDVEVAEVHERVGRHDQIEGFTVE